MHNPGKQSGVRFAPKSGMNATVGDVLKQGQMAIWETDISEVRVLLRGNDRCFPAGDGRQVDSPASASSAT